MDRAKPAGPLRAALADAHVQRRRCYCHPLCDCTQDSLLNARDQRSEWFIDECSVRIVQYQAYFVPGATL
jgi:hypothetical protein